MRRKPGLVKVSKRDQTVPCSPRRGRLGVMLAVSAAGRSGNPGKANAAKIGEFAFPCGDIALRHA